MMFLLTVYAADQQLSLTNTRWQLCIQFIFLHHNYSISVLFSVVKKKVLIDCTCSHLSPKIQLLKSDS